VSAVDGCGLLGYGDTARVHAVLNGMEVVYAGVTTAEEEAVAGATVGVVIIRKESCPTRPDDRSFQADI